MLLETILMIDTNGASIRVAAPSPKDPSKVVSWFDHAAAPESKQHSPSILTKPESSQQGTKQTSTRGTKQVLKPRSSTKHHVSRPRSSSRHVQILDPLRPSTGSKHRIPQLQRLSQQQVHIINSSVSLIARNSMAPRIEVVPRPKNLRLYTELKCVTFDVAQTTTKPVVTSNRNHGGVRKQTRAETDPVSQDTFITLLELFLGRAPAKRIVQTEVLVRREGMEMTATEVIGGHWGGVLRLRIDEVEYLKKVLPTEEEYEEWRRATGDRTMSLEEFCEQEAERRRPEVRIKRFPRGRGGKKDKGRWSESGKGIIWYDTNGYEVPEQDVQLEGEGEVENDEWVVFSVGAEGWFRIEWDVDRWEGKAS